MNRYSLSALRRPNPLLFGSGDSAEARRLELRLAAVARLVERGQADAEGAAQEARLRRLSSQLLFAGSSSRRSELLS